MGMRVESRQLGDVVVLVPSVFRDERGFFCETFRADQFRELGLPDEFVQDNHSGSVGHACVVPSKRNSHRCSHEIFWLVSR
jgi:dTDP-4-dehydrorhamnose 3,5-epimerase-like enzyme